MLRFYFQAVQISQASPAWQDYIDYVDAIVLDGLKQATLTSLKSMLNNLVQANMSAEVRVFLIKEGDNQLQMFKYLRERERESIFGIVGRREKEQRRKCLMKREFYSLVFSNNNNNKYSLPISPTLSSIYTL